MALMFGVLNTLADCSYHRFVLSHSTSQPEFLSATAGNVIYFGSGRGASRPVEVLKTLAIHRRAGA